MDRFWDKYRIPSARLKGWYYATPGYYFVTICCAGREAFFRQVVEGEMRPSAIGEIVEEEWLRTEQIRPNVTLDEWVIMPNHMHGIIVINDVVVETPLVETPLVETPRRGVSTDNRTWKPGTLGAIINPFKSKCTKRIRVAGNPDFAWQGRFYDHIIRDPRSLDRIRRYIRGNPAPWDEDEYCLPDEGETY